MSAWNFGSGFLSSLANFFSTQSNNAYQEFLQQEAQNWNAEQATIAWNRSVEQWNRENEYNSPVEQMKRLREAGINPALAYASGVFNQAGNSPEAPVSAPARAANTQAWQVDPMMMAQIGLVNAERDKAEAEAASITEKLPEEVAQIREMTKNISQKTDNLNTEVSVMRQQLLNMEEDRKLTIQKQITESFNRTLASEDFKRKSAETVAAIKEMASRVSLNQADADLKRAARKLTIQEYEYNILANAQRLIGLQLDNQLKGDQHTINRLNSALLGYEVNDGYANFKARSGFNRGLDNGSILYRATNSFVSGINYMLSPLKGILGIHL